MLARTHIVAGAAAAALAARAAHLPLDPAVLLLGGLGGLAPDLDHPQALLTRRLPGAGLAAGAALQTGLVRHRGVFHSIAALLAVWLLAGPAASALAARLVWAAAVGLGHPAWAEALWGWWGMGGVLGFAAGYASHILVDTWNTTGVQWFWPLRVWVHSPFPNIPVGTWPETVLRWAILLALVWWSPPAGIGAAVASEAVYRIVRRA